MVVCKYFQQGNCRFGQYCRFEHINYGHRNKPIYNDGKNIALVVAEDVLAAERGGQWMLSCFGPFAEQPCIPGMEDVSPEEVRWMMYKAQAEGNADQVKIQFQQMCQDMKAKHEALKHPTTDTLAMLEKLQQKNDKSSFAFSGSSLNSNSSTFGSNNVFGASTPFGSSNTFGNTNPSSSIFGGSAVFGSKPGFSNPSIFGGNTQPSQPTGIFANAVNTQLTQSAFGAPAPAQTFGSPSVFGGQSTFGQPATFSSTASQQNIFSPAQTSQASIFGGGTNSVFASPATQSSTIFATPSQTSASTIFGQAATTPAFGQSSVFGNMNNFASTPAASQFGGQANFSNLATATPNTFMQQPAPNNVFGAVTQNTTANTFGAAATQSLAFGNNYSQPNTLFTAPFASVTTTTPSTTTSTFGNQQQYGNVFSTPPAAQQSNVFGASAPFAVNSTVTIVDDSMYTDDNSLSPEDKNAFAADTFVLSQIPLLPPSQELS